MKKNNLIYFSILLIQILFFSFACQSSKKKSSSTGNSNWHPLSTNIFYKDPIETIFENKCNPCHSYSEGKTHEGNYNTEFYDSLFNNGTDDTPNLIKYDSTCLLIRKTQRNGSMAQYLDSSEMQIVYSWIIMGARFDK